MTPRGNAFPVCNLCSLFLISQGPLGLDGKPVSDDRAVLGGPGMGGPGMVGTVGLGVTMGRQRERSTENLSQCKEKPFGHHT